MSKPLTSRFLNETSAKRFGKKLKLESFSDEQLYDVRNRLRTRVHRTETTESYDSVNHSDDYHQNRLFLDIVNAEITERENKSKMNRIRTESRKSRRRIIETAEQEAELIMAAKDMVDKLSGWMEHTGEMQSETILSLGDAIRMEKGSRESQEFINVVRPALEHLMSSMEQARQKLINGVEMLTGSAPDMGEPDDAGMEDPELDTDSGESEPSGGMGDVYNDDFDASPAAKGGASPVGREKRESTNYSRRLNRLLSEKKR